MKSRLIVLFVLFGLVAVQLGCANQLPKYADKMDKATVGTKMVATRPTVNMNSGGGGGVLGAVNTATGLSSGMKIKDKIEKNVTEKHVIKATRKATLENLSEGPPFAATEDEAESKLKMEIWKYGVKRVGGTPRFTFMFKPVVYYKDKKIYKNTVNCTAEEKWWQDSHAGMEVAGNVAVGEAIEKMSDEEFLKKFDESLNKCINAVVAEMREDAKKK